MPATLINCALIALGSLLGLLLGKRIQARYTNIVMKGLGLCVLFIGLDSAFQTENLLCLILCIVLGSLLGEWLDLEARLDTLGAKLERRFAKSDSNNRFTQGFMTASLLFCVGAMAVTGSIEAGIHGNYEILISKGVIDGILAISFAATMGIGVAFSVLPLLLYQGGLTLLAGLVAPYLSSETITELSAVGGLLIVGIALNILGLGREKVKVGNMLPAIFLPLLYLPLSAWIAAFFA